MDTFVTTALVGTTRQHHIDTITATAVDELTIPPAQENSERELLLRAGAWAVYKVAGQVSLHLPVAPEPAPAETLPACSPTIAELLQGMFNDRHPELLPEALLRLRHAGQRLPYELLPTALASTDTGVQSSLIPVLGERGFWLSRCDPAWSWATDPTATAGNTLPASAETIWGEGTARQRCSLLQRMRAVDPARARAWLEATWKQEKAEFRIEAVKTFSTGLSADDEAFLEQALNDRSAHLREAAASLLARLTTSAYAQRMRRRANQMLSYEKGKLTVTPPTALDKQWEHDGIIATPHSSTIDEQTWWLTQVLERIPPAHWEERFATPPTQLIAQASTSGWEQALVEGWTYATIRYGATTWVKPLCDTWVYLANTFSNTLHATSIHDLRMLLEACLPPQELEERVLHLLIDPGQKGKAMWPGLLSLVPRPWGKLLGDAYLQALRTYTSALKAHTYDFAPWDETLEVATLALPVECFQAAVVSWVAPEHAAYHARSWYDQLNTCSEAIDIRQRLIKEFAS